MQSNKYNSRYSLSLRGAAEARGNGRGVDNTAGKACAKLGYKVLEASTTNKFVEVLGSEGTALVAFYTSYGGFQVEVATADLAEDLAQETGTELARQSNGRRVAVGFSESKLGEVLAIVTGGPVKAVKAETKAEAEVEAAALKAPTVQPTVIDQALIQAVTAAVLAALAAAKKE
jgi:hypothetical protein